MRKNYSFFNLACLILLLLSIFLLVFIFQKEESTVVDFEDPGLEQAVRAAIGQEEGSIEKNELDLLQELDAAGYGIESLEGIENLPELSELNLEDNQVKSLSPLQSLTKLQRLNLRNNQITDLQEVDFEDILYLNIEELNLHHNVVRDEDGNDRRLSDISLIGRMITLQKLDLRDNHIENLEPLGNLRNLEDLDLRENRVKNIDILQALTNLEELNLRDNRIESLEALHSLFSLTELNIHSNEEIESLEPLSGLVNLETLIMEDVPIRDQGEFLKQLTSLQRLNVIDTGFEKIDSKIIEDLRRKGALAGEVRPARLVETLENPQIAQESGFYTQGFELEIDSLSESGHIYYTTDGSEPTLDSERYQEPLTVRPKMDDSFTVVRAKVISEDHTMSSTVTKSYFVHQDAEERFDLPVFSLVTDPAHLFDEETGIYTKENSLLSGSEWERPVHLDFFETDGQLALEQEGGVRIHGGATRIHAQNSLRLYADSEYDDEEYLAHDFFEGLERLDGRGTVDEFKTLILRNSGNDWPQTMFNDGLMQTLAEPLGTMDTQAYRPSLVFINGKYYGIHNIRERFDEYYFESHYDLDSDDLVILEQNGDLYRGNNSDTYSYRKMINYVEENGLEDEADFNHIQTLMDTENYRDYYASQIFFANADWPHNNVRFWRKKTDGYKEDVPYGHDGRWRWLLFDLDHGFYRNNKLFGEKASPLNHKHNTIDWVMGEYDGRSGTETWPNFLFRSLMANQTFKEDFLNRMNDLMNSYYSPQVTVSRIDTMVEGLEDEMPFHIERWGAIESMEDWRGFIDNKYLFAQQRPEILRGFIMEEFDIEETVTITVGNESEMGHVRLNTLNINSELPGNSGEEAWSGQYFKNLPVTLEAVSKEGYRFSRWEGIDSEEERIKITPSQDLDIQAVFTPISE